MNFIGQLLQKNGVDIETTTGAQSRASTAETNAKNYALNLNTVANADTRSVNSPPSFYGSPRGLYNEFKSTTTVGLNVLGGGTYCTVITDGRWTGASGGRKNQLAFTDSGKIFTRLGNAAETAWEAWLELEDTTGSQAKVDAHANLKTNPHAVTKAQIGLGSVLDYGLATQAEAEAGVSAVKYMTPQRTKQAIDKFKPTKLSELTNDIGAGGGIKITTSATAPTGTSPGDFWYREV